MSGEYAFLTSLSSSSHDHSVFVIDQDLTMPRMGGYLVNAVHGLMCYRVERRVRICNIHTRQVVELPMIRSERRGDNVWSYFGHDSVHDIYKVLSLVWEVNKERRVVRSEQHVLVLGAKASWKKTQCYIPHRPLGCYSQNVFINNVLYYGAWTNENGCVLMSFDFSSEEFKLIELPNVPIFRNLNLDRTSLIMNYKGRVGVFYCKGVLWNPRVDFWVIEDADKSLWSEKKTIALPVSEMDFDHTGLMGGTSHSCKVWLIKTYHTRNRPTRFSIYDLEKNEITRRIEIRSSLLSSFKNTRVLLSTFWYDIENIMHLET